MYPVIVLYYKVTSEYNLVLTLLHCIVNQLFDCLVTKLNIETVIIKMFSLILEFTQWLRITHNSRALVLRASVTKREVILFSELNQMFLEYFDPIKHCF